MYGGNQRHGCNHSWQMTHRHKKLTRHGPREPTAGTSEPSCLHCFLPLFSDVAVLSFRVAGTASVPQLTMFAERRALSSSVRQRTLCCSVQAQGVCRRAPSVRFSASRHQGHAAVQCGGRGFGHNPTEWTAPSRREQQPAVRRGNKIDLRHAPACVQAGSKGRVLTEPGCPRGGRLSLACAGRHYECTLYT